MFRLLAAQHSELKPILNRMVSREEITLNYLFWWRCSHMRNHLSWQDNHEAVCSLEILFWEKWDELLTIDFFSSPAWEWSMPSWFRLASQCLDWLHNNITSLVTCEVVKSVWMGVPTLMYRAKLWWYLCVQCCNYPVFVWS